jgi:hypothetical protein
MSKLTEKQINNLKDIIHAIVLHHTAGSYTSTSDHYHFCILYSKKTNTASVKQVRSVKEIGSHTWKRNTGRIGISVCGAYVGYPVQLCQFEAMGKLVAELCILFEIDMKAKHKAMDLDNTHLFHDVPNVADHVFYAKMDRYIKIDIGEKNLAYVLEKAMWFYAKIKSGHVKREYTLEIY